MNSLTLPIETKAALIEQYHRKLRILKQFLLIVKGEKSRAKMLIKKSKDPAKVKKMQKSLEQLEFLRWELEDAIEYARICRRRGDLFEAIRSLDKIIKAYEEVVRGV